MDAEMLRKLSIASILGLITFPRCNGERRLHVACPVPNVRLALQETGAGPAPPAARGLAPFEPAPTTVAARKGIAVKPLPNVNLDAPVVDMPPGMPVPRAAAREVNPEHLRKQVIHILGPASGVGLAAVNDQVVEVIAAGCHHAQYAAHIAGR